MSMAIVIASCAACNRVVHANPYKCPSIRVEGKREPICKACFNKWNQIHRTSKGLEPVPLHPDAYQPIDEREL